MLVALSQSAWDQLQRKQLPFTLAACLILANTPQQSIAAAAL